MKADVFGWQTFLNENFLALARELDIIDAKSPDDVYRSGEERKLTPHLPEP